SKPHSHRAKLEEDQEHLKNSYNNLLKQHTDVEALLQDLRLDITKRGSIPSETKMAQTNKDLDSIEHTCQALLAFYNDNCPKWKRTWESELHGIVQEKQFSDDVHQLLRELLEDTAPLRDLFTKLEKIAELKAKERLMKSGSSQPKFLSIVPHEDDDLARQIMLSEIQGIEIDHERRLEALERATKSREKELTNRVDEFEKELGDYVTNQKLRKTGGTEELERRRKKKDEEVLKAMLSSMAEVRLAADIGANPG
ncbi:Bud site selection protein 6, partial [Spiromyces aspiralis]